MVMLPYLFLHYGRNIGGVGDDSGASGLIDNSPRDRVLQHRWGIPREALVNSNKSIWMIRGSV